MKKKFYFFNAVCILNMYCKCYFIDYIIVMVSFKFQIFNYSVMKLYILRFLRFDIMYIVIILNFKFRIKKKMIDALQKKKKIFFTVF